MDSVCPICLEPAQTRVVYPTCGHGGCAVCVSLWRKVSNACPLCKQQSLFIETNGSDDTASATGEEVRSALQALADEKDETAFLTSDVFLAFERDTAGYSIEEPNRHRTAESDALIDQTIARFGKNVQKYPACFWGSRQFQKKLSRLNWTVEDIDGRLTEEQMQCVLPARVIWSLLWRHHPMQVVAEIGLGAVVGLAALTIGVPVVAAMTLLAIPHAILATPVYLVGRSAVKGWKRIKARRERAVQHS